jgi:hypothetical protein
MTQKLNKISINKILRDEIKKKVSIKKKKAKQVAIKKIKTKYEIK